MNALFEAAHEVQQFIHGQQWAFCIIGGLAVVRWGQPRATQDVDISLLAGFGSEHEYVDRLLDKFPPRIAEARQFALESRVVLAKASNGVPLDIVLAGFPYEERVIARASSFAFASAIALLTASAEDMLVLKAFAGRDQDWADAQGIIERQIGRLDWSCILEELTALCALKEDDSSLHRLQEMQHGLERS
jgi:hypothetical protein